MDGNGATRNGNGNKDVWKWLAVTGWSVAVTAGVNLFTVQYRLQSLQSHAEDPSVHMTIETKDARYIQRSEFDAWQKSIERQLNRIESAITKE